MNVALFVFVSFETWNKIIIIIIIIMIMIIITFHLHLGHLADAFIQSDLQ